MKRGSAAEPETETRTTYAVRFGSYFPDAPENKHQETTTMLEGLTPKQALSFAQEAIKWRRGLGIVVEDVRVVKITTTRVIEEMS